MTEAEKEKYRNFTFRGRRLDDPSIWVVGWYAPLVCNNRDIIASVKDRNGSDWRVQEETVGQFTGCYDKKVQSIFEDDILKDCGEYTLLVIRDCAGFKLLRNDGVKLSFNDYASRLDLKIIGNKYDNPELLTGELAYVE